mgnify:CR=1 FL=1|tara:strand:+ start:469 stop:768 length:300 start_codon:yes stop_codon:yes gene_type:complete
MKIRLVKSQKKIEENDIKNCYSDSQLEILNQFHKEMDESRAQIQELKSEIQELIKFRQKLIADIQKKQKESEPITAKALFSYCSELNKASKGKFGDQKK